MNIYQKLNAAREDFHSTKLKKTGRNTYAEYNYFELGDFLIPALAIFKAHGICAHVSFGLEIATMQIVNSENPEDRIEITSPMGSAKLKAAHEVQNIGAVETYQRRYLWMAALEIVEHDAVDASKGADTKPEPDKKQTPFEAGKKMVHKPTDGAGDFFDDEKRNELEEMAHYMADCQKDGKMIDAINLYYAPNTFADNDERIYLWSMLDSKLRSAIKANKPKDQ